MGGNLKLLEAKRIAELPPEKRVVVVEKKERRTKEGHPRYNKENKQPRKA